MNSTTHQYATFHLGGEYLGVDVLKVQEVLRCQSMTPVPQAPGYIAGLINLRGQIVTALDLRKRLGMPDRSPDHSPMNVIIRTSEGPISLLVDDIGDVLEVPSDSLVPTPNNMAGLAAQTVTGIHKLDGCLLGVLDIEKLTNVTSEGG